jgi:pyruvate-formate lyase
MSEKQKENLAKGRAKMLEQKRLQKEMTQREKDEAVLKRAKRLETHQKNIKKAVGIPLDESSDEELVVKIEPRKKVKPKKVVYVQESESESESEEEIVVKKPRKKPVPPTPNPPANGPRGSIVFY